MRSPSSVLVGRPWSGLGCVGGGGETFCQLRNCNCFNPARGGWMVGVPMYIGCISTTWCLSFSVFLASALGVGR